MFGLGLFEILILAGLLAGLVVIAVVVVFTTTRRR